MIRILKICVKEVKVLGCIFLENRKNILKRHTSNYRFLSIHYVYLQFRNLNTDIFLIYLIYLNLKYEFHYSLNEDPQLYLY